MKMKKYLLFIPFFLSCTLFAQVDPPQIEEGWESGDFSSLQWERPGSMYLWEITSEGAHSGRFCVRSGNYYTKNTESVLQLPVYLTEAGNLSYFRKIFSSPTSGFFRFYLDGQLRDSLSGYGEWNEFQCPIASGFHILRFCYTRNSAASKGSDCVWIDDIHLPSGIMLEPQNGPCNAPAEPRAEVNGNEVRLSWDDAYQSAETLYFDDLESHEYGAINSSGTIGWHYIDGDGVPTNAFSSLNFLNEGAEMAFIVLDDELISGSPNPMTAHSGHRFLGSPFHSNRSNDDWIVSPELNFSEPFTFSFFARSFSTQYPDEQFVAAYSITDDQAGSFIPLHSAPITTFAEWTEYAFLVPAQARYVAIHCISYDQYIFCLDDLSIRGATTSGHTCNIYRDGILITSQVADSLYIDHNAAQGEHCYAITYNCSGNRESDFSPETCITMERGNAFISDDENVVNERESLPDLSCMSREVSNSHMASTLEEMFRWNKYPTYGVYTELLQYFKETFPNLCQIDTILAVTPHPDLPHSLFGIHISNTLGQPTTKPAFLYSSSMHGTEVVCYYLMLHLADYILNNATSDSAVMKLLDNVDLYICPLENPDGAYHLTNDIIWQGEGYSTYHNYNDVQLNRNYPHLPGLGTEANIQPETQAIIDWVTPLHFVMSVNFHCGAELINYPWDSWTTSQRAHADADWFRYTGQNYATLCHAQDTSYMYGNGNGYAVIDGGDWGVVSGSRQDYMTYYQHCREVTMEISHTHVVTDTNELQTYWDKSKDALLSYAVEASYGFGGTVTDAVTHEPVEAKITVVGHDRFHSEVYSHLPLGAYHRPIMAGTYTVEVSAPCYQTETFTVTTRPGVGMMHNVELQPLVTMPVAYDQYILEGMQTTVVALSQNEVFWYESDTATEPFAVGNYFTTPVLFDTVTYYFEGRYEEDTLSCVSPRNSVTVYVIDTATHPSFIPDNTINQELVIYPNPVTDYLTIKENNNDISFIMIFDSNGKLVMQRPVASPLRIDVSPLKQGTYFLRTIAQDGSQHNAKFIKAVKGGN